MSVYTKSKGFSVYFCFGEWGGFAIKKHLLCLGFLRIALVPVDIERLLYHLMTIATKFENLTKHVSGNPSIFKHQDRVFLIYPN